MIPILTYEADKDAPPKKEESSNIDLKQAQIQQGLRVKNRIPRKAALVILFMLLSSIVSIAVILFVFLRLHI